MSKLIKQKTIETNQSFSFFKGSFVETVHKKLYGWHTIHILWMFVTARKQSCEKVMFSQARISHSVNRVQGLPSHNTMGQADPPQKADPHLPPPRYGQPAGGMHPTRMHTC